MKTEQRTPLGFQGREDPVGGALSCHMGGGPEPLGQTGISDWLRALTCRENASGRLLIY